MWEKSKEKRKERIKKQKKTKKKRKLASAAYKVKSVESFVYGCCLSCQGHVSVVACTSELLRGARQALV